jgi:hypothetical protein
MINVVQNVGAHTALISQPSSNERVNMKAPLAGPLPSGVIGASRKAAQYCAISLLDLKRPFHPTTALGIL